MMATPVLIKRLLIYSFDNIQKIPMKIHPINTFPVSILKNFTLEILVVFIVQRTITNPSAITVVIAAALAFHRGIIIKFRPILIQAAIPVLMNDSFSFPAGIKTHSLDIHAYMLQMMATLSILSDGEAPM